MRGHVAACLALLLLPGWAAAQGPGADCPGDAPVCRTTTVVTVDPADVTIEPLTGHAIVRVVVQYTYPVPNGALSATRIRLELDTPDSTFVATVSPSTLFARVQNAPAGGSATITETLEAEAFVAATAQATAFVPASLRVRAEAERNGGLGNSSGEATFAARAAFRPAADLALPPEGVSLPAGGSASVSAVVTNYGNARTRFSLTLESWPEGYEFTLPDAPIVLDAPVGGGEPVTAAVVRVEIRRGLLADPGNATFHLTGEYAGDAEPTNATRAFSTSAEVRLGGERPIPAPGAATALTVLAIPALMRARHGLGGSLARRGAR
ncbi:MAG TPA: hypothetical protein VM681_05295 [Candidatus Thermoplasmatota archaeon]|nr:hypothetical protein [Candidatus Thermoplasmatota archaeon]